MNGSTRDSPAVGRDRARPRAWRFSSPYLPAKVSEADVQLVLLAGLPLVTAAVFCMDKKAKEKNPGRGEKYTCSSPFGFALDPGAEGQRWLTRHFRTSESGSLCSSVEAPSPTQMYPTSRPLCLKGPSKLVPRCSCTCPQSRGRASGWGRKPERIPQAQQQLLSVLKGREQCACVLQDGSG